MNEYVGRCEVCGEALYTRGCYNCEYMSPPLEEGEEDVLRELEKELEKLRHAWKRL